MGRVVRISRFSKNPIKRVKKITIFVRAYNCDFKIVTLCKKLLSMNEAIEHVHKKINNNAMVSGISYRTPHGEKYIGNTSHTCPTETLMANKNIGYDYQNKNSEARSR